MKIIRKLTYTDKSYIKLDDEYPLSAYIYGEVHNLDDVVNLDILARDILHRNGIRYTGDPILYLKNSYTCSYWPQCGRFIPDNDGVKDSRRAKGNKFIRCSKLTSKGVQGIFDTTMIEFERRVATITSISDSSSFNNNIIVH